MPSSMGRPASLYREPTEHDAFACEDKRGRTYWVRVLDTPLFRKRVNGREAFGAGKRLETPEGWPVNDVGRGSYLIYSEERMDWVAVKAVVESAP